MRKVVSSFVHSIRLPLVASYLFVAILAVGLVGLLGLELVHKNAIEREQEYISHYANLALGLIDPYLSAGTVSQADVRPILDFVGKAGGVRVRLLDPAGEVIADSRQSTSQTELQELAERLAEDRGVRVIVYNEGGKFLVEAGSGTETVEIHLFSEQNPGTFGDEHPGGIRLFQPEGKQLAGKAVPVVFLSNPSRSSQVKILPLGGGDQPLGAIEVSEGPNYAGSALDSAQKAFTIAGSAAVILSLAVGLIASARISAPLRKLASAVEMMGEGSLGVQAPPLGRDEVGALSAKFNQMSSQLEATFERLKTERDTLKRFVGDASHELRTPVTALQIFLELLEDPDIEPRERQELLSSSQAEVNRLAWITNNLLDLSRMDAGMVQLNLETVQVVELLETVFEENHTRAVEKGIRLQLIPPEPGLAITCDRQRLLIALTNLVENALKFTDRGGRASFGAQSQPGQVSIWVEDTGSGIFEEDLPHIFERFYRGKDRSVPGSGLGLAMVKSIVELHRGDVSVRSIPGQGSKFTIYLPLN